MIFDERAIRAVRALQCDLPLVERPFAALAAAHGLAEDELLALARQLQEEKVIRRYGATVKHRRLGYAANGMSVWRVPADRADELGAALAARREVSHCYTRPAFPGFPYNLYAMIHGKDRAAVEAVAAQVAAATGVGEYHILYSVRELKKSSMRYFTEDENGISDPSA
jgi:DNA-binding Lrp family transcriptional regulator